MKLSNCHITALDKLKKEIADSISIQYTKNSKVHKFLIAHPNINRLLIPIKVLGITIEYIGWTLIQLGELLITGRWLHFSWREDNLHKEFVPLVPDKQKWFPPLLFKGKEQEVNNEHSNKT